MLYVVIKPDPTHKAVLLIHSCSESTQSHSSIMAVVYLKPLHCFNKMLLVVIKPDTQSCVDNTQLFRVHSESQPYYDYWLYSGHIQPMSRIVSYNSMWSMQCIWVSLCTPICVCDCTCHATHCLHATTQPSSTTSPVQAPKFFSAKVFVNVELHCPMQCSTGCSLVEVGEVYCRWAQSSAVKCNWGG